MALTERLVPCPSCYRHVRQRERACPFCASVLDLSHVAARPEPTRRLTRGALWAFAALATSSAGCTAQVHEGDVGPTDAWASDSSVDGCLVHVTYPNCYGPDTGYGGPSYDHPVPGDR